MTEVVEINKRDRVESLEKGLKIIEAFSDINQRLSPSTAARRTGINRTAARRHLLTLKHLGYLESDGQMYWLTPQILRLGWSYVESAKLPKTVQPFLQRISASLSAEAYFSVLDQNDLVVVSRSGFMKEHHSNVMVGARACARHFAAGLVLMAQRTDREIDQWLEKDKPFIALTAHTYQTSGQIKGKIQETRQSGYCLLEQQVENNARSMSVLVRNSESKVVGAISVHMSMSYETQKEACKRVLPVLEEAMQFLQAVL
jgi:IclR family pca regulon transcriptional regulator